MLANPTSPRQAVSSRSGSSTHYASTFSGGAWGGSTTFGGVGSESRWIRSANCPTRDEIAFIASDGNADARVFFRISSGFSTATVVETDISTTAYRPLDIAYESVSGDLLAVYWDNGSDRIAFRTGSASALSGESTLTLPSTANVRFATLFAKPGSDQVLMLAINSGAVLYAALWDGTGWGSVTTLENDTGDSTVECYGAAFERNSSDAVIVYRDNSTAAPRFRVLSGTSWSTESSLPSSGSAPDWVRIAAHPSSDVLLAAFLDNSKRVSMCRWDGSSWGTLSTATTDAGYDDKRPFDIAYQTNGNAAILAYSINSSIIQYRTWNGSSWSAQLSGPSVGAVPVFVQLTPANSGSDVLALCATTDWPLMAFSWNGSAMTTATSINSLIGGGLGTEAFTIFPPSTSKLRITSWKQIAPQ